MPEGAPRYTPEIIGTKSIPERIDALLLRIAAEYDLQEQAATAVQKSRDRLVLLQAEIDALKAELSQL